MRVKDLIDRLLFFDPESVVFSRTEWGDEVLDDAVGGVADDTNAAADPGTPVVCLSFDGTAKSPPPAVLYRCNHCGNTAESRGSPVSCKKCSWLPMMKPVADEVKGA